MMLRMQLLRVLLLVLLIMLMVLLRVIEVLLVLARLLIRVPLVTHTGVPQSCDLSLEVRICCLPQPILPQNLFDGVRLGSFGASQVLTVFLYVQDPRPGLGVDPLLFVRGGT